MMTQEECTEWHVPNLKNINFEHLSSSKNISILMYVVVDAQYPHGTANFDVADLIPIKLSAKIEHNLCKEAPQMRIDGTAADDGD